jgi:orotidine-5'-phosphate decarboxylase
MITTPAILLPLIIRVHVSQREPFRLLLEQAWQRSGSLVCVGLDPRVEDLPAGLPPTAAGCLRFCRDIVDAVADRVCAFKAQAAHFGALGAEDGLAALIAHIHERHPGIPVILDAKRGDIGSTAVLYAREAFVRYDADAVTVNPYLGPEGLAPFLAWRDRGVVVLCRTSNPESAWLQDSRSGENEPAYLRIARAAPAWNTAGNVMLVAGATYPEELAQIRRAAPDIPLLVPGVGAQGGSLADVIAAGRDRSGRGLVINVSRSVLQASRAADYAVAARAAVERLNAEVEATARRIERID